MSKIIPLFSNPIYISSIDIDNSNLYNQCETIQYDRFSIDNGFVSTDRNILLQHFFSDLRNKIEEELKNYLHGELKISILHKCEHISSWIMLHQGGDFAQRHLHTNSMFSGIYYINAPNTSGDLYFHCPINANTFKTPTIDPTIIEKNIYNSHTYKIVPKNNMLVLFPSHLIHSVSENISGEKRYCLAFNYFLRGKFGSHEVNNLLEL
jgi:uncharacterized protein (TIGR02466 family)